MDTGERRLVATMPLHAITSTYGEEGLRARFAVEIETWPEEDRRRLNKALELAARLHASDRRERGRAPFRLTEKRRVHAWQNDKRHQKIDGHDDDERQSRERDRRTDVARPSMDRFGRIDIVVNNVGDFRWGTLAESSLEDWRNIISSNLMTVLYVSRAALPHLRRGRWGRIINLGAVGAERAFGQAKISAYAAAKAAVVALSRSLALEEAKNGITVNVVNPSSIDENELTLSEARSMRDARFPIGRPPTVEDVAATVAFFASEEAEYVTGQVMNVSGGWML